MNRKITVYFPSDYRKDFFKNDLLDGTNHEIYVEKVLAFNAERRQFYLVSGFDDTKKRSVAILLMKDGRFGGMLKKVPLMDYGEIDKYMKFPVALSDNEIDSLLKKSGYAFSSMPLTTISDILSQDRREEYAMENTKKLKVIVFYDRAGRKYILSSAAESLELPNPNTIKYLPLKNIAGRDGLLLKHHIHTTSGFRLLDNLEYTKISLEFDVERHEIEPVKIIDYQGRYFV